MSYVSFDKVSVSIKDIEVMTNLSFTAEKGQVLALVGENGSGKTVALKALCGFLAYLDGSITVDGKQIGRDSDFPKNTGILIEDPAYLANFSASKNLELVASIKKLVTKEQIRDVLRRVGLDPDLKRPVRVYSLGMKQRLGIAMALMEKPDLLILDEPTNALDEEAAQKLITIIDEERKRGACIIITSHDADFIKACADEVVELQAGKMKGVQHAI